MIRHYLDHASTSPLRPAAAAALIGALELGADPGRVYREAQPVRALIEGAREQVAAAAGARPREVVFTSGGTEAVNAAVWGVLRSRPGAVLAAAVEHSAVRLASARLAPVVEVAVDGRGRIHPEAVREAAVRARAEHGAVALIHCQWANHEVGTRQPVADMVEVARELGAVLHVDACAGWGHLDDQPAQLGADLVSLSAHKVGGPLGAGALLVRRGLRPEPFLVGGDQERGRRGGLENLPALAGFGAAAEELSARRDPELEAARALTGRILDLAAQTPGLTPYGDPVDRAAHIVCLGAAGVEAEAVVIGLDQAGLAVHSGSACSSEALESSPVLAAMGVDADRSLRLSVGWSTSAEDVAALEAALPAVLERLRALRS